MNVAVIFTDQIIGIDGVFFSITFDAPQNLRVYQWDGHQGHAEWTEGPNTQIDYIDIEPYIILWNKVKTTKEEEKTRLIAESEAYMSRYDVKRSMAYPPMVDYLDGIVKGDQQQIDKYITDCLTVKAKYPKPSSA